MCRKMAKLFILLLTVGLVQLVCCEETTHFVDCGPADTVCECDPDATVCSFQFYIEFVFTFAKYNISIPYAYGQGERFYVDDDGNLQSYISSGKCMDGNFVKKETGSDLYCNEMDICIGKNQRCSDVLSVDGKTYKLVIAVNKQFPGPTLIVTEGQIVSVDVHNNLSTEGVSVHWHGQHQKMTNFMDGVGHVTQCSILPGQSFRYIFTAGPSGTFWYHSHERSQRSKGLFGAFIVKEKPAIEDYPVDFIDDPGSHTLTIADFFLREHEELYRTLELDLGEFPELPPNVFPSDKNPDIRYFATVGPDFSQVGVDPFWSALINGRGRHSDVPYNRSRLSIFEVESGQTYRFRLINVGTMFAFRFSINGHKLKIFAMDGYVVEPEEFDYILLHSGERYEFLLKANQEISSYGIKAETLEIKGSSPPFEFIDHKTEAILHYSSSPIPKSTKYEEIFLPEKNCTQENPCKMLNCPFEKFHPSFNIECTSIDKLRLAEPTPEDEMPDSEPDVTYFGNLGGFVSQVSPLNSINDIHFLLPQFPVTTHNDRNDKNSFCAVDSVCDSEGGCFCTTVMDIGDNVTIRLVVSSVGIEGYVAHPMHIHGHSAHIVKVGYGEYSEETGFLAQSSQDLTCSTSGNNADRVDNSMRCPNPRFRFSNQSFQLDRHTIRRDAFVVPPGGYVVMQFRSDNPGYWLFHCHLHLHQRQGMALIIREAVDQILPPPEEMKMCASFLWDVDDFMAALEGGSSGSGKLLTPSTFVFSLLILLRVFF